MPELPEVETIRRALEHVLLGRCCRGVRALIGNLREPISEVLLNEFCRGEIRGVRRRAKFLLFDFPKGGCLIAHLGMTGSFRIESADFVPRPHDRALFLLDQKQILVYHDIRRFGLLRACTLMPGEEYPPEFVAFGPEPLSPEFTGAYLRERLIRCKGPVKPFLMNQKVVVGVGNIYASEALFRARISPLRAGNDLASRECATLERAIRAVLAESIEWGGTTISDYRQPDGSEGHFALNLRVYGRMGLSCLRRGCRGVICRIRQAGRSTFYCPGCQR